MQGTEVGGSKPLYVPIKDTISGHQRRRRVYILFRYACGHAVMSVRHVLLACPRWGREREWEEELGEMAKDLKKVLETRHGATATIRLILRTDPLEQFKATVQARREERRRGAVEE